MGYVMLGWKQLRWTPIYENVTGLGPSALSNRYRGLAGSDSTAARLPAAEGGLGGSGFGRGFSGVGGENNTVSPEAYNCALVADVPPAAVQKEEMNGAAGGGGGGGGGALFLRVLPHLKLHFR